MGWEEQTASGRWRGGYWDGNRKVRGPSCDYRHEAESWWKAAESPDDGVTAEITVGDYAKVWLGRRVNIDPSTRSYYAGQVAAIRGDDRFAKLVLAEVESGDVLGWLARLESDGVGHGARNARLKTLRSICKAALGERRIPLTADPTAGIRRAPAKLKRRGQFMGDDDLDALLDVVGDDSTLRLLVLLGCDAGLRWEEMTALAAGSVTTNGNAMSLNVWQKTTRKGRRVIDDTKNHAARPVPVVTGRLRAELRRAVREATLRGGPTALLVCNPDGSPLRYEYWHRSKLKPAYAAAGIMPVPRGWHDLRHTLGSRLAEQGVPTKIIASILGHSHDKVTEIYIHASTEAVQRDVMAKAIGA